MKIYKHLPQNESAPCVLAIGNFDGVHRGHQALLRQARALADKVKKPLAVLTFEPHPRALFRPDDPVSRLTPVDLKIERLAAAGVDALYMLEFDWNFASQSADDFIKHVLQDGIGATHVVVGEDFRFGQMRKGTPDDVKAAGIDVTSVVAVCEGEEIISSSLIREALRQGDLEKANHLLGWDWEIHGTVVKGDQRGRELGYPTANFALGETVHPAYGVYAAMVQVASEDIWRGAAVNVGIRPMFEIPEAQVESYIFDFSREIYGQVLKVKLVKRIRSEARFDTLEALVAQIDHDCDVIRGVLKGRV